MATKFYLHRGTTTVGGTLPSTQISAVVTTNTATGASTNRTMDTTIGATTQTSLVAATTAAASTQIDWNGRWVSDPLAAQSLTNGQTINHRCGYQQSNTNSAATALLRTAIFLWRPSTGLKITTLTDGNTTAIGMGGVTTEVAITGTSFVLSSGATVLDGDVLVIEIFGNGTQSMNTSYNRTFWYDGTTENSTTNNAAYVEFVTDTILFQQPTRPVYINPMPPLLAQ